MDNLNMDYSSDGTGFKIGGGTNSSPVGVRPGHCVFCGKPVTQVKRRKLEGFTSDEDVPSAIVTPELTTMINQVWVWVTRKSRTEEGFNCFWSGLEEASGNGKQAKGKVGMLPASLDLCHSCGVRVNQVKTAMETLRQELEALRKLVEKFKDAELDCKSSSSNQEDDDTNYNPDDTEEPITDSDSELETDDNDDSDDNYEQPLVDPLGDTVKSEPDEEDENKTEVRDKIKQEDNPTSEAKSANDTETPTVETLSEDESNALLDKAWNPSCNQFVCLEPNCVYKFVRKNHFLQHLKRLHNKILQSVGPIACITCGITFTKQAQYKYHILKTLAHQNDSARLEHIPRLERCTCDLCGELLSIHTILEHVKGHVGDYAVPCFSKGCSHVFSNTPAMRLHFKNLHTTKGEKSHECICDLCGFKTKRSLTFRAHLKHEHERSLDKHFRCPLPGCDKRFVAKQSVDWHIGTHTELKPVTSQKCDQCDEAQEISKIEEHLTEIHKCEIIIACQQCPCKFSSREALVQHLFVHRFKGMFCDICQDGVKYTRHVELRAHYQAAHELKRKLFMCRFCDKEYEVLHSLNQHIHEKHSKAENPAEASVVKKRWSCDLCLNPVSFHMESLLITHKIRNHGAEPFSCGTCGDKFTSANDLSRHEKEHAGMTFQNEWKCNVDGCGKVFVGDKKNFTRHMKFHQEGKRHVCETCGKAYYEANGLKTHHETVHLGLRPWVCEICGEGFTGSSTLKRHKLIHSGERPFACPICDQRFRQKVVLNTHLRSHEEKGTNFKPSGPMKQVRKRKAQ